MCPELPPHLQQDPWPAVDVAKWYEDRSMGLVRVVLVLGAVLCARIRGVEGLADCPERRGGERVRQRNDTGGGASSEGARGGWGHEGAEDRHGCRSRRPAASLTRSVFVTRPRECSIALQSHLVSSPPPSSSPSPSPRTSSALAHR